MSTTATLEPEKTAAPLDLAESIAEAAEQPRVGILELPVASIEPWDLNPRKLFAEDSLHALAASILSVGVLQNIVVRCTDRDRQFGDTYQIVAGERRWRAAKLAGLATIPARVLPDGTSDAAAYALTLKENAERNNLNAMEEAEGYQQMLVLEPALHQEDLGKRLGISQSTIANALRLLKLPGAVRDLLRTEAINKAVGIALCSLSEYEDRCIDLARKACDEEWPQSRTQAEVRKQLEEIQARIDAAQTTMFTEPTPEAKAATVARQQEREAAAARNTTDDFTAIPPPGTVETPPAAPADPAPSTEPEAPETPAEPAPIEETPEIVAEAPTPPQASAPAEVSDTVAPTAIAEPATMPAPISIENLKAAEGPQIATSIAQSDDDWLWERNLTLGQGLALLRQSYDVIASPLVTPMAHKCLKAITDAYNAEHPDEQTTPAARLEALLIVRAESMGIDTATLQEIPE